MFLEVVNYISIDETEILEQHNENPNLPIPDLVENYVMGLDDCEYYLIGPVEIDQIVAEIEKILKEGDD